VEQQQITVVVVEPRDIQIKMLAQVVQAAVEVEVVLMVVLTPAEVEHHLQMAGQE
jgi:hypothetical protein